ncbi:MAG TPA: heme-binding domain-containing protein [Candidatus Binataceae bacterium]
MTGRGAGLLALGFCALAAQLVTVAGINPPASSGSPLAAPKPIETLLTRACYDCHSNRTRWPWYSRVAPVSWLVARDVALGRKELNFSEWGSYYPQTRMRKLQWMGRMLRERSMPPWTYRLMHPAARVGAEDRAMLERWIESGVSVNAAHISD